MLEIKNAKIVDTSLGYEGHGIMTFWLHLNYGGGSCQAFGGYSLGGKNKGWKHAMGLIETVLEVVGVGTWEDLKGEHIRVKAEHEKVHAIGNFLDDEWLDIGEWCKIKKSWQGGVE